MLGRYIHCRYHTPYFTRTILAILCVLSINGIVALPPKWQPDASFNVKRERESETDIIPASTDATLNAFTSSHFSSIFYHSIDPSRGATSKTLIQSKSRKNELRSLSANNDVATYGFSDSIAKSTSLAALKIEIEDTAQRHELKARSFYDDSSDDETKETIQIVAIVVSVVSFISFWISFFLLRSHRRKKAMAAQNNNTTACTTSAAPAAANEEPVASSSENNREPDQPMQENQNK